MKTFSFIIVFAFLVQSCDKNNNRIRKIDGTWEALSYLIASNNGNTNELITETIKVSFTFDACNLNFRTDCDLIYQVENDNTKTIAVKRYKVLDAGSKLQIIHQDDTYTLYDIVVSKRNELRLKSETGILEDILLFKQ